MNAWLVVFSLNLGMSFAILVLYVSSLVAISLVVFLITASIVAANTSDLTTIRQEKVLPAIMIGFAVLVFVLVTLTTNPSDGYLFYDLIVVNFTFLVAYVIIRTTDRRHGRTMFGK